ncbi:MAG TPA: ergothioneine biosynthesis PLP-dependent enzyme EgtE [Acidimicrobiales bacterium]|nr:ergothioneine biosynthesis PLP-dependent enzyme EgtE [Acidimicrobiales bacterium]
MTALEELGEPEDRWARWRAARPDPAVCHLDSAAAGRSSLAVLTAVAEHALLEARVGAYVAQEEAGAALSAGREALARLVGIPADGIAFVESASVALGVLLEVWPFGADPCVGVVPSEWGPNLAAFARRGLRTVELPVDGDGHVDLAGLARHLSKDPPSLVHLTQVASHRPLVQPAADVAAVCRASGVPLVVDAAQALGHVDTASGADVVYATSRKWLTGPRGVGVLAVDPRWHDRLRDALVALEPVAAADEPIGSWLSSRESHVAGRVGLGVAAREHLGLGAEAVRARLAAVGRATREVLGDLDDWEVVGPVDEPCAITALRPTSGQDVMDVRARLLHEHRIVTTGQQLFRAPHDMSSPTLRISPHVDVETGDLARLREALASL